MNNLNLDSVEGVSVKFQIKFQSKNVSSTQRTPVQA